ncbi:polysaccharide pyruvyl transferase family protein [Aerococcaceae bacterium 50-4]
MKALLISRFNVPNLGDLVIGDQLYREFSDFMEVDRFSLFGNHDQVRNTNEVFSDKEKWKNYLLEKLDNIHLLPLINSYMNSSKKSDNNDLKFFEDRIQSYDLIIFGGGNMLMSNSDNNTTLNRICDYIKSSRKLNKSVWVVDVGIGPFYSEDDARNAASTLNKCDFISFRDEKSYKVFKDFGGNTNKGIVSVDSVLRKEYSFLQFKKEKVNKKVALNIINSDLIKNNYPNRKITNQNYIELIAKLLDQNISVKLYTTTREDNVALSEIYNQFKRNPKVQKTDVNGLKDIENLYKSVDLVIGSRMHSMILSYVMYTPIVGLSWQSKIDELFTLIDDEKSKFDLKTFGVDSSKVIDQVNEKINSLDNEQRNIQLILSQIKEKSINYRELIDTLER